MTEGTTGTTDNSDSAFWQFSLKLYAQPGVPEACLALQDDCGVDVNLLFLLIFIATRGQIANTDKVRIIDDSVRVWREQVVRPLRKVRRALKNGVTPVAAAHSAAMRTTLQRAELEAERLQQIALERDFAPPFLLNQSTEQATEPESRLSALLKANLEAYASFLGLEFRTALTNPISAGATRLATGKTVQ